MSTHSNKAPHPPSTIKINSFTLATTLAAIAVIAASPCPSFVACDVRTWLTTGSLRQRTHFSQDARAKLVGSSHSGFNLLTLIPEPTSSCRSRHNKLSGAEMLRCIQTSALRAHAAFPLSHELPSPQGHVAQKPLLSLRGGFPSVNDKSALCSSASATAASAAFRTLTVSTFNVWCPLFKRIAGNSQRESGHPDLYLPRQRAIIDLLEEVRSARTVNFPSPHFLAQNCIGLCPILYQADLPVHGGAARRPASAGLGHSLPPGGRLPRKPLPPPPPAPRSTWTQPGRRLVRALTAAPVSGTPRAGARSADAARAELPGPRGPPRAAAAAVGKEGGGRGAVPAGTP